MVLAIMQRVDREACMEVSMTDALDQVKAAGLVPARWQEILAEHRPNLLTGFLAWSDVAQECGELGAANRELIIFCLDSAVKWPSPFIDNHIKKALAAGMSVGQLIEAAVLTGQIVGPHSMNHALTALAKVLDEAENAKEAV
jgi:alkylhydroperoxidase/carboxymuconolactone decarboxylase family protein YurZ